MRLLLMIKDEEKLGVLSNDNLKKIYSEGDSEKVSENWGMREFRGVRGKSKVWKCPNCKKEKYFRDNLVMKVCYGCQVEMERKGVVDGDKNENK